MKRIESVARYVNLIAAAAVVVGVFVQIYLIASYVYGDSGALATHETNGRIVVGCELVAFLSALVGWRRSDLSQVWVSLALFLVGGVQVSLAKDVGNSPGVHALHGAFALIVVLLASVIVARTWPVLFPRAGGAAAAAEPGPKPASRRARIWLLSVSLLAAAGFVGWAIGHTEAGTSTTPVAGAPAQSSGQPWSLPNGDLFNTRLTPQTPITAANVSKLGVAWTMPLTASSIYGSFAANPVTDADGVVYLQDLDSNVFAVDLGSGRVLWTHPYHSQDIGPNGVTVVDRKVYGATAKFAFALDAATGKELWRNTTLVAAARQKAGGELASGFGIDIQPQVANGTVYLSSAALLGGGIVYALDAATGRTLWTFDSVIDPAGEKIIGGGAWNTPAVAPDGTVYFGFGNMYQPASIALAHPSRRLYTDSTVALDGKTGKLKWYFQAVPNDFHDWDMQLSPIYTESKGRKLIVDAGKMGYVYALDASNGAIVWKTKVGVHNGHDADGTLSLQHRLKLKFPLAVEPGIVGGVETNMAVADGVVYAPVANLPSTWKSASSGLGGASFGAGRGEMVALDLASGRILWDTKLSQMPDGDATVANDLVFTTTFDGYLLAFDRSNGAIVWKQKLPAFTNAPVAIVGDTLITAASYPGGKGQTTEVVAFRLDSHGSFTSPAPVTTTSGSVNGASVFGQNCASCHTLAAAHATGTVGPNLDQTKLSEAKVADQVTNGGGGMPAFGGRLTKQQIDAVAKFVATSARK